MNNLRTFGRSDGAETDESEHPAVWFGKTWSSEARGESAYTASDESVYAASSSSSSEGNTCGSSLSSSDGYLKAEDSCCCDRDGYHCDEVGGYWELRLADERRCCLSPRSNASAVVARGECSRTRSSWTTSSLLCIVSALLAACSLSSLAACISLTTFSLMAIANSLEATATAAATYATESERDDLRDRTQIDSWTERLVLSLPPPAAGDDMPSQYHISTHEEPAVRYSWDCVAQPGRAKCRPVRKVQSRRESTHSRDHQQQLQPSTKFRVLTDGVYHASAQIAGVVWQPPPTLLRVVIARVTANSVDVNVTAAHAIAGAPGGGDLAAGTQQRGAFSVYTAVIARFKAGEELQAQVVCVEEPNCVVHVNGTSSLLTLEKLN